VLLVYFVEDSRPLIAYQYIMTQILTKLLHYIVKK